MVAYPDQIFNDSYLENRYAEVGVRDFMILNSHTVYYVLMTVINVAMEMDLISLSFPS